MKLSECQITVLVFIVFVIVWILLKVFGRDEQGQNLLDDATIRKYVKYNSHGYYGPINFTTDTGFDVLGNPFIDPAPLYSEDNTPLMSQIPPFNVIASGYGF